MAREWAEFRELRVVVFSLFSLSPVAPPTLSLTGGVSDAQAHIHTALLRAAVEAFETNDVLELFFECYVSALKKNMMPVCVKGYPMKIETRWQSANLFPFILLMHSAELFLIH